MQESVYKYVLSIQKLGSGYDPQIHTLHSHLWLNLFLEMGTEAVYVFFFSY